MVIRIVDISYWQNPDLIDYSKLCKSADGFIIRTAYGNRKDTAFERHYSEITARGKPIGCYHFITEYQDLASQVETHRKAVAGKVFKLGYWADVELEAGATNLTASRVNAYLSKVDAELSLHDIYTGKWCWMPIMGSHYKDHAHRKLWMAAYVADPTGYIPEGWATWHLWQYTSSGKLDGYAGNLDMNYYNGTTADFGLWVNGGGVGSGGSPTTLPSLYYPLPQGYPISQLFGANPAWYTTSKGHNGVDWACPVGTPVYAMQDGVVLVAEARQEKTGYGRQVRIQHREGISIYGHLSHLSVKAGDSISAKQEIGLSGGATDDPCSGMSTGPHLHAEYRLTAGAPQVPGGYVYNAINILPLLKAHEEQPLEILFTARCDVTGLRIRTGPNTTYSIKGYAEYGKEYPVYEVAGDWMRIDPVQQLWVMGIPAYMIKLIPAEPTDNEKLNILWKWYKEQTGA